MLTILFDGIAYGMLLFVLACGLSVTLGLMNFVNLAHGSFAMAGGYITLVLVNRAGLPFFAGLPIAFVATALIGALFERTLYVHVYSKSHLDQVLFTIGLVFMAGAAAKFIWGPLPLPVRLPDYLRGQIEIAGRLFPTYRSVLIVVTVGGTSSITGPFAASLLIGLADVAGKYYVPKFGAFVIYTIMIIVLILRPQGLFARAAGK